MTKPFLRRRKIYVKYSPNAERVEVDLVEVPETWLTTIAIKSELLSESRSHFSSVLSRIKEHIRQGESLPTELIKRLEFSSQGISEWSKELDTSISSLPKIRRQIESTGIDLTKKIKRSRR